MPVIMVIGGQYGSEGKGKVAHAWQQREPVHVAVRVGGPNSGHTVTTSFGKRVVLQQLPVAVLHPETRLVLPAGSYIDVGILERELADHRVEATRLSIDPDAVVITSEERRAERAAGLMTTIGSTGSGTGAAVVARVSRDGTSVRAADMPSLQPYIRATVPMMRRALDDDATVLVEGTQGFGLSVLHGGHGVHATSRDTSAAGLLSEAGLSPLDVAQVIMVVRTFPIRVAGNSGPLPNETDWDRVGRQANQPGLHERTTVTRKTRRVARFDADVVRRALAANRPTTLVLNHVDYLGDLRTPEGAETASREVARIEYLMGRRADLIGVGPADLLDRDADLVARAGGHPVEQLPHGHVVSLMPPR